MSKATTLARTVSQGGFLQNGTLDQSDVTTALGFTPENTTNKNQNSGYAGLDNTGKVASQQLPSYVDDVLEYANQASLPASGESGKIYITLNNNKVYRWSGSVYVEIVATPGSTDSVAEGSTNLYYTNARARGAISVTGNGSYDSNTGVITVSGVSVGGSTTQVQYNSSGSLAGSANLVWDNTNVRLGIGTSSPGTYLEVASPSGSGSGQINIHSPGGGGIITKLISERAGPFRISAEGGSASGITFETGNSVTPVERMRITNGGNVGIGTTSPNSILQVNKASANPTIIATRTGNSATTIGDALYLRLNDSYGTSFCRVEIGMGYGIPGTQTYTPAVIGFMQINGTSNTNGDIYFATRSVTTDTAPTERMRIDTSGNVGIGMSSPVGKLHVVSSTGGSTTGLIVQKTGQNYFQFYADTNNTDGVIACAGAIRFDNGSGTERMRLNSSGQLLLGTSSARAVATANSAIFEIEAVNAIAASLVNNNNSSGSSAQLMLGKSRGSSAGGTTIVQSGDELGEIRFAGADGVDLQSYAGSIRVEVDGTPGSDDMPGRMIFSTTADGAATSTERMRITSAGRFNFYGGPSTTGGSKAFYFDSGSDLGTASSLQYGMYVTTGNARYTDQTGIYSVVGEARDNTIGSYGGAYIAIHGKSAISSAAGGQSTGVYGETLLPDWNYAGRNAGVRGLATGGTSSHGGTSYGLTSNNGAFGGHFTSYGKGDVVGVYADAYHVASPAAGALARPLICGTNGSFIMYVMTNGGIANYSGNNTNLSDIREKKNIQLAGNYLDKLCAIPVKTFLYTADQDNEQSNLGVIAQDVQTIAPEFVVEDNWPSTEEPDRKRLAVYQTDLVFAMMRSIQELKAIVDQQAAQIAQLQQQ